MPGRPRITDTTDYFGEFLEEHPDLWPAREGRSDVVDPFSEFGTEIDPAEDRWLQAARGDQSLPPKTHGYRHILAVALVLIGLVTPAGIISTVIVARELTVSTMEMRETLPPLPSRVFTTSVDRLMGIPSIELPSAPQPLADSTGDAAPRTAPDSQMVPGAVAVANPSPPPAGVLPLTTALLSAPITAAEPLGGPPPSARVLQPETPEASPASAAAAPPLPPRPATNGPAESSAAVRVALERYRQAFSRLDADSAKSVWPAVDEKALARAFSQLSRQLFVFDVCNVDVSGPRAIASCRGRAQYVPNVGSRDERIEPRQWTFTLRRAETQWTIESVDSR